MVWITVAAALNFSVMRLNPDENRLDLPNM